MAYVKIKWNPEFLRAVANTFSEGGTLQQWVDSSILESITPYLPFDTGMLAASGRLNTIIGSGKIIWNTPYAQYLYYGLLMVDPDYLIGAFHNPITGRFWSRPSVKKIPDPQGRQLQFQKLQPKSGPFWAERWMEDNLVEFTKNLTIKAGELIHQ